MDVPAREQLTIIWNGEEVPGLMIYGLFHPGLDEAAAFPEDRSVWGVDVGRYVLTGNRWRVVFWNVAVAGWPSGDMWTGAVRGTLEAIVNAGAQASWIGLLGFCDPPDLFDPAHMSRAVVAAMTADKTFRCAIDPDIPLASLTDDELLWPRRATDGLSNVASAGCVAVAVDPAGLTSRVELDADRRASARQSARSRMSQTARSRLPPRRRRRGRI